jgi:hypothetical protein
LVTDDILSFNLSESFFSGNSNHISHSATNLEGGSAPETDAEYETVSTLTIPQGGSAPESDAEYATVSFHMDKKKGQTCNAGSLPNISVAGNSKHGSHSATNLEG